jgi:replicative DNA helicase
MRFNRKIALFSLEMSKEQLAARMLSMDAGVDQQKLRTGYINDEEWDRISESVGRLSEADIYIDDTPGITLVEMRSKARRLMMEHGFDLLIVDYLQLMQGSSAARGHENRVMEISEISRGLKGLARELNVPVMALSQLSRAVESRSEKKPQLSDLRESGSIEQDADIVMSIYRDEVYNSDSDRKNIADIIVAKHRNGPIGQISLYFLAAQTLYRDLDLRTAEDY